MKKLTFILFCLSMKFISAQEWQSISQSNTYGAAPYVQFIINPYKNDIWLIGYDQIAVVESEGFIQAFPSTFSPVFLWGADKNMAFTPTHVYYAHDNYGLFTFDNYVSQLKNGFSDYNGVLRSDADTIYILRVNNNEELYKFTDNGTSISGRVLDNLQSKNGYFYGDIGQPAYYLDSSPTNFIYLYSDPDYLLSAYNEMKFTRLTDTLFVSSKLGISKVFNYDVFDTITPYNTINMPSPNVLEMEWDMNDNLWAVFGTPGDTAFAIAQLENDTWINRYDANNSPINFNHFLGLEIDTLSNLWVADNTHLHTLLTANSPAWLSKLELDETANFNLFPNPSNGTIHIETESKNVTTILIYDLSGRKMEEHVYAETIQTQLSSGTYILQLMNNESVVGQEKIVVR